MCNSRAFDGLFNHHTWNTFNCNGAYRLCSECGRTESWLDDSQGGSWTWEANFDDWLTKMFTWRKWCDEYYPHDEKKALKWFREQK